jgi:hypothetical protein
MFRALGLLGLLIALVVAAVALKHQLAAQPKGLRAVDGSGSQAQAAVPDAGAAQARQVPQQVQDDVNRIMQEHSKQLEQNVERSAP